MALDLKIKTNAKFVQKRFQRIEKRFKGIIQKRNTTSWFSITRYY